LAPDPPHTPTRTALLIDDDRAFLIELRRFLMENGYRTLLAEHGEKGLTLAGKFHSELALVIVDLAMPVLGGYDVIATLAKGKSRARIIAMTATPNEYYLEIAKHLGAHAALRKPPPGDAAAQAEWLELLRAYL
jgi:CheY-like chemotaxis protein